MLLAPGHGAHQPCSPGWLGSGVRDGLPCSHSEVGPSRTSMSLAWETVETGWGILCTKRRKAVTACIQWRQRDKVMWPVLIHLCKGRLRACSPPYWPLNESLRSIPSVQFVHPRCLESPRYHKMLLCQPSPAVIQGSARFLA